MTTYTYDKNRKTVDLDLEFEIEGDILAIVDNQFVNGRKQSNWCKLTLCRLLCGAYILKTDLFTAGRDKSILSVVVCADVRAVLRALDEDDVASPDLVDELLGRAARRDPSFEGWGWDGWIDAYAAL